MGRRTIGRLTLALALRLGAGSRMVLTSTRRPFVIWDLSAGLVFLMFAPVVEIVTICPLGSLTFIEPGVTDVTRYPTRSFAVITRMAVAVNFVVILFLLTVPVVELAPAVVVVVAAAGLAAKRTRPPTTMSEAVAGVVASIVVVGTTTMATRLPFFVEIRISRGPLRVALPFSGA